ncbi:MAG: ATP-dependent endonuclease [Peptidiphaga sp.]
MRIQILDIKNFRGIASGHVIFKKHSLLVGGNNIGKSTVCEALELVLGPERLYHRPVIDEHDFYRGRYQKDDGSFLKIVIRVVLTSLNLKQQLRFHQHLRLWNEDELTFVDEEVDGISHADDPNVDWALPVVFIGRYDPEEDDFVGDTFFDHPLDDPDSLSDEEKASLGQGRSIFTRAHKRDCGFIYLRALRTGSRALSLQRGSLLDTILRLGEQGGANMWPAALRSLKELNPAIGEIRQLKSIRAQLQERLGRFINLASEGDQTSFYASDLTRDNLREVVKLFIATWPSNYPVPFSRQGTGSVNLLVFALLTMIADLKEQNSAIFVMEEPEIALPPHIQRRVVKYVLQEMGQSIVTSHSPYIIEQYEAENVVVLGRDDKSCFTGKPIDRSAIEQKNYRAQRRQFAEAILSRAVFVVEGATEVAAVNATSIALERFHAGYSHIDLSGVSLFNAGGDQEAPKYGPIFKALGKPVFGIRDKPNRQDQPGTRDNIDAYDKFWESPESGVERILVDQVPESVLHGFFKKVSPRPDYPANCGYNASMEGKELKALAQKVLKARKGDSYGYGYAAILIEQCQSENELPSFIRYALLYIDRYLTPSTQSNPIRSEGETTMSSETASDGQPDNE